MHRLDFFVALNWPWQLIKIIKTKLWLRRLTQLTVGTWWIDMSHLERTFLAILHLFSIYTCTRKPLLENLFVVDRIFLGRVRPKDIQYCHSIMFQLSRFEQEAPVLRGQLPSSRFFQKLPFWDDPGFNVRSLRVFQVDPTFCKLAVKILAACNEIHCVSLSTTIFIMSSRCVSTKARTVLTQAKEVPVTSLKINAVCDF